MIIIRQMSKQEQWESFPQTRYLGSKRKLLSMLFDVFSHLEFNTVIDPFSGTGSVSYLLKTMGKSVTSNDILESGAICARALVENNNITLGSSIDNLTADLPSIYYPPGFIEKTFDNVFFERDENRFIDGILPRIQQLSGARQDLAYYSLFQACLAKRPYNLFHRANISMRRTKVRRSFGNKTTWERPFPELIKRFSLQADNAIFDSGNVCKTIRSDIFDIDPSGYDLVYLDPPYISSKGTGVDYFDYYHFMEGMVDPVNWPDRILHQYKHKPLIGRGQSPWSNKKKIKDAFQSILTKFSDSIIVISYRSDGIPTINELSDILIKVGKKVEIIDAGLYKYALSNNKSSKEIVIIAK